MTAATFGAQRAGCLRFYLSDRHEARKDADNAVTYPCL